MRRLLTILPLAVLTILLATPTRAQYDPLHPNEPPRNTKMHLSIDLLSNPGSIDIDSYIATIIPAIARQWDFTEPTAPPSAQEQALITLTLAPNGKVLSMKLEDRQSPLLDKAAWTALKTTHFSPPPAGMTDPDLKLRLHFTAR
ncbi:MAG: energy transducer TonB [Acidobacteriaceae bacterium]